jgi:glutathione S-transferase
MYINQLTAYLLSFRTPALPPKETIDFFREQLKADWEYIESHLSGERKRLGLGEEEPAWIVGGKYSVADISAWAQLACTKAMVDVEWETWGLKEVERWSKAISEREAVKKGFFALQEKAQ